MGTFVAFLRGINVGAAGRGRKAVPMAELRAVADGLGFREPRTHVQSGNLVFAAAGGAKALAARLEAAIAARFGFDVPVVVRAAADVRRLAARTPFGAAADERPDLVHVGFAKGPIGGDVAAALAPYCAGGERVVRGERGRCLWVDYAAGVARSKLTPAVLDRVVGSHVTMRNLKTLRAVAALCG